MTGVQTCALPISADFHHRWRLRLSPEIWEALKKVTWSIADLTVDAVFSALPMKQLPLNVVTSRKDFLNEERRRLNVLRSGNFEESDNEPWQPWSERAQRNVGGSIVTNMAQQGQKSAHLEAPIFDELRYEQSVSLKPKTKYLLSGWIKTQDVVPEDTTRKIGANLSIDGGREVTESVIGTSDWRYVSLIIDSGTRTGIKVCARLGRNNSKAKGSAWFDDLVLIPLTEESLK